MIVSGHIIDIEFKNRTESVMGCFVSDENISYYIQSNLLRVINILASFMFCMPDLLVLLELKEIEKSSLHPTNLDIQRWYILDVMVFV